MRRASLSRQCRRDSDAMESRQTCNRCIIFPATTTVTAQTLERSGNSWSIHTNIASDLTVLVEGNSFHLHKLPLVSKSKYLNKMVFERASSCNTKQGTHILIVDIPGGIEAFKSVVEFCYGLAVHLTASNIAPIYCAAYFLEMTEDMEEGNLISKSESFLTFVIFSSWHDTFSVFRSCETLSSWPYKVYISRRCCDSIAWKVSIDPYQIHFANKNNDGNNDNHIDTETIEQWWFEDVSSLRIDYFVDTIGAIKAKGMRLELVSACIMHWATKYFAEIEMKIHENNSNHVLAPVIESLIRVLPMGLISFNFLFRLLRLGFILNINQEQMQAMEKTILDMFESCCVEDLMVNNYGDENDSTICDVNLVRRLVESYTAFRSCNPCSDKMAAVTGTVDAFLAVIAKESNLSVETFQSLAKALPESARPSNDGLYMAIDMYLKSHPSLTDKERKLICRGMEYRKLSLEARMHAVQNERLPLRVTVQYLLTEQVMMARSILPFGEMIPELHGDLCIMKEEVEKMKVQINDLQLGHAELHKAVTEKSHHPWRSLRRKNCVI